MSEKRGKKSNKNIGRGGDGEWERGREMTFFFGTEKRNDFEHLNIWKRKNK